MIYEILFESKFRQFISVLGKYVLCIKAEIAIPEVP